MRDLFEKTTSRCSFSCFFFTVSLIVDLYFCMALVVQLWSMGYRSLIYRGAVLGLLA